MKKLTNSVLAVVLSSSFAVVSAQKTGQDSTKTKNIEEVVITGALGIKRKADAVVSAQQVVSAKELTLAAPPDAIQGLQAKVSGLIITQTNSSVNPTNRIILRGVTSINGNSQALVVIDNVISSATVLQQIPPDAIENVNVIKGLQGAALYGSQGVNGVVIVTTKKGSNSERMQFTLTNAIEATEAYKLPIYQKKYGKGAVDNSWAQYQKGDLGGQIDGTYYVPWENTSWGPAFSNPKIGGMMLPSGLPQLDNKFIYEKYAPLDNMYGRLFDTGVLFQNGLTMNVGGYDSYAFLSINRQDNSFVIPGDKMKRNSFIFKAGKTFGNFHIDGNIQYVNQSINQTDAANGQVWDNFIQNPVSSNVRLFRNSGRDGYTSSYADNPFWTIQHVRSNSYSDYLSGIISMKYDFNKHINITYTGNLTLRSVNDDNYNDGDVLTRKYNVPDLPILNGKTAAAVYMKNIDSYYYNSMTKYRNYYGDLMLNFDYQIGDNWGVKFNIGNNIQDMQYSTIQQGGTALDIPGWYHINNVTKPAAATKLTNEKTSTRITSGFANLDLAYKDYLFLNGTVRYDRTSVFSRYVDGKFTDPGYFYYSGGVSFIPTKAFKSIKGDILNYMKVSATYTKVGNSSTVTAGRIDPVMSIPTGYPFNGLSSYINNLDPYASNLRPEFISTVEANLSLGLFKDRVTIEGSVYQSNTKDLITKATISSTAGLSSLVGNYGEMRLRGFDVDLGLVPVRTKDFEWRVKASYQMSRSKILELADGLDQVALTPVNDFGGIGTYAIKGQDFAMIQGGSVYQRDPQGRIIVDSDGTPLFTGKLTPLARTTPDFTMNFSTSIRYKGFTLSGVAEWRKGGAFIAPIKSTLAFSGVSEDTADFDRSKGYVVPNSVQNTGTEANPNYVVNTTPFGGLAEYQGANNFFGPFIRNASEYYVVDATFFKIREIALSYDIPKSVFANTFINSITVGAYARNPFVQYAKTNRNYADPETSYTNDNRGGYANSYQYPTTRTFGFNIKATF